MSQVKKTTKMWSIVQYVLPVVFITFPRCSGFPHCFDNLFLPSTPKTWISGLCNFILKVIRRFCFALPYIFALRCFVWMFQSVSDNTRLHSLCKITCTLDQLMSIVACFQIVKIFSLIDLNSLFGHILYKSSLSFTFGWWLFKGNQPQPNTHHGLT